MGRSWSRDLMGAAIVMMVGGGGCGLVSVGGKPVGGTSGAQGAETATADDAVREAGWDGRWGSTFGTVKFTQKRRTVTGTYPGGTLECEAPGMDLLCKWADNTGSGRAKFRWDSSSKATGTFGKGESDSDQGEWVLTFPAPPDANTVYYDSHSDGSFSIKVKNECREELSYCVETCGNSMDCSHAQQFKIRTTWASHDVKPGAKLMDGDCKKVLKVFEGGSEEFTLCK